VFQFIAYRDEDVVLRFRAPLQCGMPRQRLEGTGFASAAEDITLRNILLSTWMAPLGGVDISLLEAFSSSRKKILQRAIWPSFR
jgi:hypothetical protein